MASPLSHSADTLTEPLPDDEPSELPEESAETLNAWSNPPKLLPHGKLVVPGRWDLPWSVTGTSPSTGVIMTGTVSYGVPTGIVLAEGEAVTVVLSAEGLPTALYSAVTGARNIGTPQLFSSLIKARGDRREQIYQKLLYLGEPEILLRTALDEYHQYGNEERLALAASLLADMGPRSFPALQSLVQSGRPECGMFIPVIAHLHSVNMEDRLRLLLALASNSDVYVRYNLLDEISTLPTHDALAILRILSDDVELDISEQAQAYLNSI